MSVTKSFPPPAPPAAGALVLFSAGQDSTTTLAWALQRYGRVETIGFDYGQRHAIELTQRPMLLQAFRRLFPTWDERLGVDHVVDMRGFGAIAESALTAEGAFAMQADGLPNSFVPGRNIAFFTYAAAIAYRRGFRVLVGGMCETDYSGYPDCRAATLASTAETLSLALGAPIAIETPLMHLSKAETWALAAELGGAALVDLIVEHTHTCYAGDRTQRHPWGYGCGACPACQLREQGWTAWRGEAR